MNEHLEQSRPEEVLSQVIALATDSQQMQNLLAEALAMAVAGSFGITPVGQHTGMTTIPTELLSSMVILLRKAFTTPAQVFGGLSLRELFNTANDNAKGVGAVYEWLRNRMTKDYLPTPELPAPIDSVHMAENLQAGLGGRNISNGTNSNTPDGISLIRFFASYTNIGGWEGISPVTKLIDNNVGWTWNAQGNLLTSTFLNDGYYPLKRCGEIRIGASNILYAVGSGLYSYFSGLRVYFEHATSIPNVLWSANDHSGSRAGGFAGARMYLNVWEETSMHYANGLAFTKFGHIYIPNFKKGAIRLGGASSSTYHNPYTSYILCGCKGEKTDTIHLYCHTTANTSITDIEIGDKENIDKGLEPRWLPCQNLTIQNINGLTADNMYNHILLRLKQDEAGCGDGVTIALGATNIQKLIAGGYEDKLIELATYGYTFTDYEQPAAE